MKKLLTAALFAILIASDVHSAEVLWYSIEPGSKLDMTNEVGVELGGRIGIEGCGNRQANKRVEKYPFYGVKYDNMPEALQPHLEKHATMIPLFGGPGAGAEGNPRMDAHRAGDVFNFQWYLQLKPESDLGNEAVVYTRKLMLDDKQNSTALYTNSQQPCPENFRLYLKVVDTRTTYVPSVNKHPEGDVTNVIEKSSKDEVIGHVTIVATAIPNSLETIEEHGNGKYTHAKIPAGRLRDKDDEAPIPFSIQSQTNNPNNPVAVEDLQDRPKPQPRFRKLKNSEQ